MNRGALHIVTAACAVAALSGCAKHPISVTPLEADDSADDLASYERLTDEERGAFTPVAFDEALKLFDEGGTGMIGYSADWCPYCQRALPVLADVALDEDTPVYYVSFTDGSVTQDQIDTLCRNLDWIEFVTGDDGAEHAASFQIPEVIAVKDGKAVAHHLSLFDDLSITSSDFELSAEQKDALKQIYADMFDALRDGSESAENTRATSASAEAEACGSTETGC